MRLLFLLSCSLCLLLLTKLYILLLKFSSLNSNNYSHKKNRFKLRKFCSVKKSFKFTISSHHHCRIKIMKAKNLQKWVFIVFWQFLFFVKSRLNLAKNSETAVFSRIFYAFVIFRQINVGFRLTNPEQWWFKDFLDCP